MADTTSLNDLPTDPVAGGGSDQNVVLQTSEKSTNYDPNSTAHTAGTEIYEQKMMNEVVTGIQQANASGGLELPSRDIPTNTVHFADEAVQPNYVPQKEQEDYIQNTDTEQEILARRMKNKNSRDSLEILYDEFQIPIIIGLLYFIFQLPVVRSKLTILIPSLFNKDGNPNLSGYIFNSIFFSLLYYVISKSMAHLQSI
jgi:hypothetical protein